MPASPYPKNVFINCPFDKNYNATFHAIIFTVFDCGYTPKCSLELEDCSENRLEKILNIIEVCQLGIHDISRTEINSKNKLPRFNMPLELGIFIGAKRYGNAFQKKKNCLILDSHAYRFQKFISDIAGHDIKSHKNNFEQAIEAVRNWLHTHTRKNIKIPGGKHIQLRYQRFRQEMPVVCNQLKLNTNNLTFTDYKNVVALWLEDNQ